MTRRSRSRRKRGRSHTPAPATAGQPWRTIDWSRRHSWSYHVLALFDLLGQSNRLAKLATLEINDGLAANPEFLRDFRDTVGAVEAFRQLLNQFFGRYLATANRLREIAETAGQAELRSILRQIHNVPLMFQGFSDTVLVFSSFQNKELLAQVSVVDGLLRSCGAAMVGGLAIGIVPRGAIDVAPGIENYPSEIYGPVLLNCHHLESHVAQWPRVAVGDGLVRFLDGAAQIPVTNIYSKLIVSSAVESRKLIVADDDGVQYVDYLRAEIFDGEPQEILAGARQTVAKLLSEFEHDQKLAPRFRKLQAYYAKSQHRTG